MRKNVGLNTVKQIWSPVSNALEIVNVKNNDTTLGKIGDLLIKLFQINSGVI